MRGALLNDFLSYARLYQGRKSIRTFKNSIEADPNLYVYFAGKHAGYVHEWTLDRSNATVAIGHFAVARELKGQGFGQPFILGFAKVIKKEYGVQRILFQERTFSPAYAQLFQRLGATPTGRTVKGTIPEWEWIIP